MIDDDRVRFEYGRLFEEYGWSLNKKQVAQVLGCNTTALDKMIKRGDSPRFKKTGSSSQSSVIFFTYDVARWICDE